MTKPVIPYGRQTIDSDDIAAVTQVLRSSMITQGEMVPRFEEALAEAVGARYAVAVSSGTAALHIACSAMVDPGEHIWTSPNSFLASANAPLMAGAKVNFVDIDPDTGLMDIEDLDRRLSAAAPNKLPRLVIPVHYAGNSVDMKALEELGDVYGFGILEDAAHALGGKHDGIAVGSCQRSNACVFSFHPVKSITTGEGGMVTTNNWAIAERMRKLRNHGVTRDRSQFIRQGQGPWAYEMHLLGNNYRMTDIQAALGLSQLKKLERFIEARNELLERYRELFADLPVRVIPVAQNNYSAAHLAVIRLQDATAEQHQKVYEVLVKSGIGCQIHYIPIHTQPYYEMLGFKADDFPNSVEWAESVLSLPLYPTLYAAEQYQVREVLCIALDEAGLA